MRESPNILKMEYKICNMCKENKLIESEIITHINTLKVFQEYQTNFEKSWWQRVELWYGKNLKDENFESFLKRAIRSQNPKVANDKTKDAVQRLNGSGSEMIDHHQ